MLVYNSSLKRTFSSLKILRIYLVNKISRFGSTQYSHSVPVDAKYRVVSQKRKGEIYIYVVAYLSPPQPKSKS